MKERDARVNARIQERVPGDLLSHLERFLVAVEDLGCTALIPEAQKTRYLNVDPPHGYRRGRLCAITLGTARIEFQAGSFEVAEAEGLDGRFGYVPAGGKAAVSLRSTADVEAAIQLARAYLATRR